MQIYDIKTDATGKELTIHGSDDFPCSFYDEKFSEFVSGEVPWHWHDEFELVYVVEGSTNVECVQNSMILNPGDAVFINSGCLHKLTNIGQADCRILNFVFAPVFIGGTIHSAAYKKYISPIINNSELPLFKFEARHSWHQQVLDELYGAFSACKTRDMTYEILVQSHLMKVWQIFCSNEQAALEQNIVSASVERRIHSVLSYIHSHYEENILVADISIAANISESECYRLFKKALKCTPNNYLLNYRLQKAANMLLETKTPITDIAHCVGFNCAAYFTKRFRLTYGITPKQFRQEG